MFQWMNFLTYAVITAATPGPNNLMSMSNAGRLGFKKSFLFHLGIWAGFSIVMIVCTLFCSLLSSILPGIKLPMLIISAVYMLRLAWKTFKSSPHLNTEHNKDGFRNGLILQFINPKIYIYCIVSMESYIFPHFAGRTAVLTAFALLLALIGFLFTLCWAAFGSAFRILFSKYAKITNTIMALLLVYCAFSLFLH